MQSSLQISAYRYTLLKSFVLLGDTDITVKAEPHLVPGKTSAPRLLLMATNDFCFFSDKALDIKHRENGFICVATSGTAYCWWTRICTIRILLIYKWQSPATFSRGVSCVRSIVNTFISARDLHARELALVTTQQHYCSTVVPYRQLFSTSTICFTRIIFTNDATTI